MLVRLAGGACWLSLPAFDPSGGGRRMCGAREPSVADTARNGIRFSLGPDTTDEEIDRAALLVVESVAAVRRRAAA